MLTKLTLRGVMAHKARFLMATFAVVIGVGFVTGSFVLTDSLRRSFDSLFNQLNEGVDVQVRTQLAFGSVGTTPRDPVAGRSYAGSTFFTRTAVTFSPGIFAIGSRFVAVSRFAGASAKWNGMKTTPRLGAPSRETRAAAVTVPCALDTSTESPSQMPSSRASAGFISR